MKTWQLLRNNPKLWDRYFIREKVLTAIRRFFFDRKFHEVETPYLTGSLPPESYLDIFETTLLDRQRKPTRAFLPTSPEPFLKKLLVAGVGNCFALPKSFRNTEDKSNTHNPEFTILEWYRVNVYPEQSRGADYTDIMDDCEELLQFVNTYLQRSSSASVIPGLPARRNGGTRNPDNNFTIDPRLRGDDKKGGRDDILGPHILTYQGKRVDISSPWERLSVAQAFSKYAKFDLTKALSLKDLIPIVQKKGHTIAPDDTWEELFHLIFLNEIEPKLGRGRPTIIYDYPVSLAALSRKKKSDPRFAERFEFYIEGLELGDAYSELTDWKEQLVRFKEEEAERKRLGKVAHPIDMDFIYALKAGMPQAGGIAMGVDRLIMLFADVTDIADTLFFPAKDLFE